jgi:predicted nucleic acid-binding protein
VIVIDSSIFLGATMPDEGSAVAIEILAQGRQNDAIVPPHFAIEVANALTVNFRRGRIDKDSRSALLESLCAMPRLVEIPDLAAATVLADQYTLTIYDATYLELAQRHRYPLATMDGKLATAARALGLLHPSIASVAL